MDHGFRVQCLPGGLGQSAGSGACGGAVLPSYLSAEAVEAGAPPVKGSVSGEAMDSGEIKLHPENHRISGKCLSHRRNVTCSLSMGLSEE